MQEYISSIAALMWINSFGISYFVFGKFINDDDKWILFIIVVGALIGLSCFPIALIEKGIIK